MPSTVTTPAQALRAIMRTQEMRIIVSDRFEAAFETLVTDGKAEEYPPLCDTARSRMETLDDNLERAASILSSEHAPLATLARSIVTHEQKAFGEVCDTQVLRQRLSALDADSPDRVELKARLDASQQATARYRASIFESLEELQAELADIDD